MLLARTVLITTRRISPARPFFTTTTTATMSWMDSWSRPSKHQATPAPYYLLPGGESTPYCRTCGRVISSRKADKAVGAGGSTGATSSAGVAKYCSARCRSNKPGRLDREIEAAFVRFLSGAEDLSSATAGDGEGVAAAAGGSGGKKKKGGHSSKTAKGDRRILVPCDAVQAYVFKPPQQDDDGTASTTSTEHQQPSTTDTKEHSNRDSAIDLTPEPTPDYTQTLPPAPSTNPEDDFSPTAANPEITIDHDALARLSVRSGTRVRPAQSVSQVNGRDRKSVV